METQQRTVDVDGQKMMVSQRGPVDGIPILMVHGFPLDHSMWSNQIDGLDPDGERFRIICPDLFGCGQSDLIEDATSMGQISDQLAVMLDKLGVKEKVVFCGLSMGGYVGWQFLQRHRERVSHLIACNTRASGDSEEAALGRKRMATSVVLMGIQPIADAMMLTLFHSGAAPSDEDKEKREQINRSIASTEVQTIAKMQLAMAGRPDMTEFLGQVDVPTLIISGRHDTLTPVEEMQAMADAIAGSTFVCIENAAHLTPLENGPEFNQAVRDFLA